MSSYRSVPLAGHTLFRSHDLDEARDRVAEVFCAHRLETIGGTRLDARQNHFAGEQITLNYIEYGAKTLIAPGELDSFYLLQIPIEGSASISNGPELYYSHPGVAAVLNPHRPTSMIWSEDCRQVLVWIDRQAFHRHLTAQIGSTAGSPLTFFGGLDVTAGAVARLYDLVLHLFDSVDRGVPAIGGTGLMARQIESTVMSGLLDAPSHSYAAFVGRPVAWIAPRQVRRAEEFMLAHLERSITLEDVARSAGVSVRALQQGFRRFRNTTPMRFLRDARLERAHRDLRSAAPGATVTEIALRWGFTHFGRFARVYRERYGCNPKQTLHSARFQGFEN